MAAFTNTALLLLLLQSLAPAVRANVVKAAKPPPVLGIGFSKSGTTSLWAYLKRHPEISIAAKASPSSSDKELRFWDNDANFAMGVDHYESIAHANAKPGQLAIDVTGTYAMSMKAMSRIKAAYPPDTNFKFIMILRLAHHICSLPDARHPHPSTSSHSSSEILLSASSRTGT